jgi:hypothetical protein
MEQQNIFAKSRRPPGELAVRQLSNQLRVAVAARPAMD